MFNLKCVIFPLSGLILFISIYIAIIIRLKDFEQKIKNYDFYSSVICTDNRTVYERRCKFRNICYKVDSQDFVFILKRNKSLLINLPDDRIQSGLQYLSSIEHNAFHFNYVDVDYEDYRSPLSDYKLAFIRDFTLIYARFKPDNLMHLIHDDLLPLFNTLEMISFRNKIPKLNLFTFDDYNSKMADYYSKALYSSLFKNANLFNKNDFKGNDQVICFENAEIGLDKSTVWYDYGFQDFQKPIQKTRNQKNLIKTQTDKIKNLILKEDKYETFFDLNEAKSNVDKTKCEKYYVVLLSRTKSRIIINEKQLFEKLEQIFKQLKVIRLDLDSSSESLDSLVGILSCTRTLIGMHGAGLIVSIFLPKHSNIIELYPYKINSSYYTPYKHLASIYDLNYFSWTNKNSSNNFYNFNYLTEDIKNRVYDDQEVERSKCCDEPYFLFRIYQDTVVDGEKLDQLLLKVKNQETFETADHFEPIFPSKVEINCSRSNRTKMILNWSRPWNVKKDEILEYEVLIKVEEIANMYNVKDNSLVVDLDNRMNEILVWIRAKYYNLKGPFNDKPKIC